jgi:hypothetical protein
MAGFFIGKFLVGKHWGITGELLPVFSVQPEEKIPSYKSFYSP